MILLSSSYITLDSLFLLCNNGWARLLHRCHRVNCKLCTLIQSSSRKNCCGSSPLIIAINIKNSQRAWVSFILDWLPWQWRGGIDGRSAPRSGGMNARHRHANTRYHRHFRQRRGRSFLMGCVAGRQEQSSTVRPCTHPHLQSYRRSAQLVLYRHCTRHSWVMARPQKNHWATNLFLSLINLRLYWHQQ